jgi:hypothetical protein
VRARAQPHALARVQVLQRDTVPQLDPVVDRVSEQESRRQVVGRPALALRCEGCARCILRACCMLSVRQVARPA